MNRRQEIEITKLVGGSNQFVRRPFLYFGALYGLFGALLGAQRVDERAMAVGDLGRGGDGLAVAPAGFVLSTILHDLNTVLVPTEAFARRSGNDRSPSGSCATYWGSRFSVDPSTGSPRSSAWSRTSWSERATSRADRRI